jgi:hypothetical protein
MQSATNDRDSEITVRPRVATNFGELQGARDLQPGRAMPLDQVVDVAPAPVAEAAPSAPVEAEASGRSFVFANLLGLMVGRIGFDFGTFVAPHVAPVGSLHVQAMFMPTRERFKALTGIGGEVGIRFYGSANRTAGPFAGIYGVGGRYHASVDALELDEGAPLVSYGGAIDVGWSWMATKTIVATLGAGIEYRFAQVERHEDPGELARLTVTEGFHPRGLFQLGRTF